MTPTFSSSLQFAAGNEKKSDHNDRTTTPVPPTKSSKGESGNVWIKSAAKRVGFRRTVDGTPRSKKEGLPKAKIVSFPDKVCLTSHVYQTFR